MLQTTKKGKFTELFTTGGYLHKKGDKQYSQTRRACILEPDSPDNYEEIPFGEYDAIILTQYKKEEYSRRLSAAIHERYSLDDEVALAANINSQMLLADEAKADAIAQEYAEYQQFRAECKAKVRAEIDAITEIPKDEFEVD